MYIFDQPKFLFSRDDTGAMLLVDNNKYLACLNIHAGKVCCLKFLSFEQQRLAMVQFAVRS